VYSDNVNKNKSFQKSKKKSVIIKVKEKRYFRKTKTEFVI